jgi:orotate phosphoribosyltransferase
MKKYKSKFIEFCLKNKIIQLGDFTLKSGRKSPYFFNAGLFNTGSKIKALSEFYTDAIIEADFSFDVMFGPAYKGIPLVVSTAMTLSAKTSKSIPFCFNRKVAKDHGEGGIIVGSPLKGNVLLIDDVMTAGTAVNEASKIIKAQGAQLAGIIIAFDRQEKGQTSTTATLEISQKYQIPVKSIVQLNDLIEYIKSDHHYIDFIKQLENYRDRYGVN